MGKAYRTYERQFSTFVDNLFDVGREDERFRTEMRPRIGIGASMGAAGELANLGKGKSKAASRQELDRIYEELKLDLPPTVQSAVDTFVTETMDQPYWREIHETTRQLLGEAIGDGLAAGDSLAGFRDRIQAVMGSAANDARAKNIARTESTGSLNGGSYAVRKELALDGLVSQQEWLAIVDGRARLEHSSLNGTRIGVYDLWDVGGFKTPYPGHHSLPAKHRCHCRCTTISVIGEPAATEENREEETVTFGPSEATVRVQDAVAVREVLDKIFGKNKVSPKDVASMVGAPGGSLVTLGDLGDDLKVYMNHSEFSAQRLISKEGGKPVIKNELFFVEPSSGNQGIGLSVFGRQVENARKLGIKKIKTHGVRGIGANGYYTWPRFGYDGSIPPSVKGLLPERFQNLTKLSELMATEEGAALWKQHGKGVHVEFDLDPDSVSSRAFKKYLEKRAKQGFKPMKNEKADESDIPEAVQKVDLTKIENYDGFDDDEEIFLKVWEEIRKEDEERK